MACRRPGDELVGERQRRRRIRESVALMENIQTFDDDQTIEPANNLENVNLESDNNMLFSKRI